MDMKKFYRCDWPNGAVTFLLAHDEDEAVDLLEDHGDNPDESYLSEVDEFLAHLVLAEEEPGWRLDALGEGTASGMPKADRDDDEDDDE